MKKQSVLIIDDEPDNFDVIETFLSVGSNPGEENQTHELHYAASGKEALSSLDVYNPDLILLDVMMPGVDGIEVCRQIKAMSKWQAVPIIMVTALNSKSDLAYCLSAGADDFISKPINGFELRARTQSMLRIKHQYDDLQNLLKSREDMVKMIVHDLRNPLQNISIGLELLGSIEYSREKQKQKLSQIYSSVKNLQELISDLLKMSLIEVGKFDLNPKKVYLSGLLRATISNFEAIANQREQSLIMQFSEGSQQQVSQSQVSQQQVFVDVAIMQRALDNLLSNAIKFSPKNSKIIVNVECLTSGETKIQVIDSGPGVPDALQQKIFEKYDIGTLIPNVSQIGLGLAFCKLVVEAHGGTICVKNNQPNGAIFEITLPAVTTAID